ncbi:MAG: hypothetical protein V4757_18745 [Pseudomonadota bacterium]
MIKVEAQLHGYSHGHELLVASAPLPKADQTVVDRLSDVAGPLRSGETFQPYLSSYPLPSGNWNVLARTWPDSTVSRPGCVRTLSLLIPSDDWSHSASLLPFLKLLSTSEFPSEAKSESLPSPQAMALPPAPLFSSTELLEALFLEEYRPVAVFDAPEPELIAIRLLTAMWPSIRRNFALSTLAFSPRRIEGRDFNLVFAPKSARQKFSDWSGRRVDGNARSLARHRWTDSIVDRVFSAPFPRLLDEGELQSGDVEERSTGALLRISLLWDELLERLDETPSAALGLLDIARTRPALAPAAESTLRAAVSGAARRAVVQLAHEDAWDLIGAMTRKLRGTTLVSEVKSLQTAANSLACIDPIGGLALLAHDEPSGPLADLVAPIAHGIAKSLDQIPLNTFASLPAPTVAQLLIQGPPLAKAVAASTRFQQEFAGIFDELKARLATRSDALDSDQYTGFRDALLPFLRKDFQAPLADRFIATLNADELVRMARGLIEADGFVTQSFIAPMAARAHALDSMGSLRDELLVVGDGARRRELIRWTLEPRADDFEWLIGSCVLDAEFADDLLVDLLQSADERQFRDLLRKEGLTEKILNRIPPTETQALRRFLSEGNLPLDLFVSTSEKALSVSANGDRIDIAFKTLERCLQSRFSGNEIATIAGLLDVVAPVLNPVWVISHGVDSRLHSTLISRNLVAFDRADSSARSLIVGSVDAIAAAIEGRWSLDFDHEGAQACANLLVSATQQGAPNLLSACGRLMRMLLRSKAWPVSSMIPATFPVVYRELAAHADVPDILKIVPFFEWDKCKSARSELVDAFVSSQVWKASDFALTACLCPHTERFLRRAASAYGGIRLLDEVERSLGELPEAYRESVRVGVRDVRSKQR